MAKDRKQKERGRFSSQRKTDVVLRILRGEDLDVLSRELGVTAAVLSEWRDAFLAGGKSNLKTRKPSPQDDEIRDLKAMVGDLTMRLEIHRAAAQVQKEGKSPLAWRRPKS